VKSVQCNSEVFARIVKSAYKLIVLIKQILSENLLSKKVEFFQKWFDYKDIDKF